MPSPFKHISVAEIMGSWPFYPHPDQSYANSVLPAGLLMRSAEMRGIKRSALYDVFGTSMFLIVDSATHQVDFTSGAAGGLTLDEVVSDINTGVGATVAYNDNGLLFLKSTTNGSGSSIQVSTIAGYEDTPYKIGLLSGANVEAGDLMPAQPVDPTRQVPAIGQMSALWGEPLTADKFNRVAMSLSVAADESHSLLFNKLVAQKKEYTRTFSPSEASFQVIGTVYTGPTSAPTAGELEDYFVVQDTDGNEYLIDKEHVETTDVTTVTFSVESGTNAQLAEFSGWTAFQPADAAGQMYVRVKGLTTGAVMNDVLMKILEYRSSSIVVVDPVDPSGTRVPLSETTSSDTQERVRVIPTKVRISGFYQDSGLTTRVEKVNIEKQATTAVSRIERNNRLYCASADFVANSVTPGDLVVWSGVPSIGAVYSNFGTYRVSKVLDAKTIEVVAEDYGPVILNSDISSLGSIVVRTDGDFFVNPYVKFDDPEVVPNGDAVLVFLSPSTLKDATDDVDLFAPKLRGYQEAAADVQAAISGIIGPSATTLQDSLNWLYSDSRNNMENIIHQFDIEHHRDDGSGAGRHANIRPDTIDMYPGIDGPTVTVRASSADTSAITKFALVDHSGNDKLVIKADGSIGIGDVSSTPLDLDISRTSSSAYARIRAGGANNSSIISAISDSYIAEISARGAASTVARDVFSSGRARITWNSEGYDGDDASVYANLWTDGTNPTKGVLKFDGTDGSTDVANILALDVNGNVGVGIGTPTSSLHVKQRATSAAALTLESTDATTNFVAMQVAPRESVVGVISGTDDGAADKRIEMFGSYNAGIKTGKDIVLSTGSAFLERWRIDENGVLSPAQANDIGFAASTNRVGTMYGYRAALGPSDPTVDGFENDVLVVKAKDVSTTNNTQTVEIRGADAAVGSNVHGRYGLKVSGGDGDGTNDGGTAINAFGGNGVKSTAIVGWGRGEGAGIYGAVYDNTGYGVRAVNPQGGTALYAEGYHTGSDEGVGAIIMGGGGSSDPDDGNLVQGTAIHATGKTYGVLSYGDNFGVYGVSIDSGAVGVKGKSTDGVGVVGQSGVGTLAVDGVGVCGRGTVHGMYGLCSETGGNGVYGVAQSSAVAGVHGAATGAGGIGVVGEASGSSVNGVVGTANVVNGIAVSGNAGTNGLYAVYGHGGAAGSTAVYGLSSSLANSTGVHGKANSDSGVGVVADGGTSTGIPLAIRAERVERPASASRGDIFLNGKTGSSDVNDTLWVWLTDSSGANGKWVQIAAWT